MPAPSAAQTLPAMHSPGTCSRACWRFDRSEGVRSAASCCLESHDSCLVRMFLETFTPGRPTPSESNIPGAPPFTWDEDLRSGSASIFSLTVSGHAIGILAPRTWGPMAPGAGTTQSASASTLERAGGRWSRAMLICPAHCVFEQTAVQLHAIARTLREIRDASVRKYFIP